MTTDTTVSAFRHPDAIEDPLTSVLRDGARRLLAEAIEAEAEVFLAAMQEERLSDGRARFVRHGHGPERTIQTGIGPVPVQRAKVRDRGGNAGPAKAPTASRSPRRSCRSGHGERRASMPCCRFSTCAASRPATSKRPLLLGRDAPNLSPSVIGRLKDEWTDEYDRWQRRDLSARRYVYIWADGVYLQARMEDDAACMLVIVGATLGGKKELVGFHVGVRESAQSWRELLVDLKARGLAAAPEIAVGDGALGFWKALEEIFPGTGHQRCWQHKLLNILNRVPKSVQPNMKTDLREVRDAPDRASAEAAIAVFAEKYGAKYPKAVECLTKDRDALLAFFDFPAEHWDHLRTSNPIESVFATVRHRTVRTKGALSQKTARLMVFKLVIAASKTWRRLKGENRLPMVIAGIKFTDGVAFTATADQRAA